MSRRVEAFIRCRTLGHSWDPIPVTQRPQFGVAYDLRCEHCLTYRRDIVSPHSGEVLRRWYQYPDGYRATRDLRMIRSEYRVQWLGALPKRMKADGTAAIPAPASVTNLAKARRNRRAAG
jgi:hypothetical protein